MSNKAADQQIDSIDEQSQTTGDQAGAADTGVKGGAGDSTTEAEETTKETDTDESTGDDTAVDLIGQEKFDKLKDDPAALRKELNRAATKKFQALSKERKAMEPYSAFIGKLQENPRAAITALAKQLGMEMGEPKTAAAAEAAAQSLDDRVSAVVKASLGPEYEDLADRLAPAIREAAKLVAEESGRPTAEQLDQVIQDSALRESGLAMEAFAKKHPDWKDSEEAMVALSNKMMPGEGMTEVEYLENLYFLVTREANEGEGIKKIVKKMTRAAQSESGGTTVADTHVSRTSNRPPTFQEAAAAARRGERFE